MGFRDYNIENTSVIENEDRETFAKIILGYFKEYQVIEFQYSTRCEHGVIIWSAFMAYNKLK